MGRSMSEYLERDMACEGLLECFHGLTELDKTVFAVLADRGDPVTVDKLADAIDRERTTAYRSLRRLMEAGFVEREQITHEGGGYHHVFRPVDPDRIADDLQRMLNDWYAKMGMLIGEFREEYHRPKAAVSGE